MHGQEDAQIVGIGLVAILAVEQIAGDLDDLAVFLDAGQIRHVRQGLRPAAVGDHEGLVIEPAHDDEPLRTPRSAQRR